MSNIKRCFENHIGPEPKYTIYCEEVGRNVAWSDDRMYVERTMAEATAKGLHVKLYTNGEEG